MKKLFKYEINESIAAKAAMNCVHKRLFKELYMGRPTPQEEVVRGEYDPYEWEFDDYGNEDKRQLVIQALVQAGLIQSEQEGVQLNNKIQQLLDKTGFTVSNEQDAMKFVKAYGQQIVGETQEQEEDYEFEDPHSMTSLQRHDMMQKVTQCMAEVLEERGIDVGGDLDEIYFIISDIIERTGDVPQFVEDGGYYPWCEEYVFDVEDLITRTQEQEEEDYSNDSHGIEMIIDLMIAKHMISDEPKIRQIAWKLIERKLNEEGMWIGEDDHEAERFVSFFGEDLVEEIAYWRW